MEGKHSVRKPKITIPCENSSKIHSHLSEPSNQVFWLRHHCWLQNQKAYQAWIVKGFWLPSAPASSCLEFDIYFLNFVDVLVSQCHSGCLGDRCDRWGEIQMLVQPNHQWNWNRINYFLCSFLIVQQKYTRQIVHQKYKMQLLQWPIVSLDALVKRIVLMFLCAWAHYCPDRTSANFSKKFCLQN